jgi:hypothetical protein
LRGCCDVDVAVKVVLIGWRRLQLRLRLVLMLMLLLLLEVVVATRRGRKNVVHGMACETRKKQPGHK